MKKRYAVAFITGFFLCCHCGHGSDDENSFSLPRNEKTYDHTNLPDIPEIFSSTWVDESLIFKDEHPFDVNVYSMVDGNESILAKIGDMLEKTGYNKDHWDQDRRWHQEKWEYPYNCVFLVRIVYKNMLGDIHENFSTGFIIDENVAMTVDLFIKTP